MLTLVAILASSSTPRQTELPGLQDITKIQQIFNFLHKQLSNWGLVFCEIYFFQLNTHWFEFKFG